MKPPSKTLDRILTAIRESKSIAVVGHVRPDGDCIGSQLALAQALIAQGKQVVCWNEDPIPRKLAFLDPQGLLQRPAPGRRFDCVAAVDSASLERIGRVVDCIGERRVFVNIDHHQSNTQFADLNWVSPRDPSTGELVYRLLRAGDWEITAPIADCLFTAVSTDTGSFQYPSTQPGTFSVAGELVKRGADLSRICNEVYQSNPISRVRLVQHVFNHFKLTCEERVAYVWLRPADYARSGCDANDSEGLIDHIRAIDSVVVACLFEEMAPGQVRLSLRSKNDRINVNAIAREFGGGGHPAAAGARMQGSPNSVQRRVLAAVKKALDSLHH